MYVYTYPTFPWLYTITFTSITLTLLGPQLSYVNIITVLINIFCHVIDDGFGHQTAVHVIGIVSPVNVVVTWSIDRLIYDGQMTCFDLLNLTGDVLYCDFVYAVATEVYLNLPF